ncbi:hypothetical protein HA052_22835 [Chromobacterium haemolyticum]|uniref:DUF4440 domain-containing protein n=1 Tax=Chromobacterium fluminis TaxID=3044269 RepID=A0ABX0LB73_9NEIS|nr:hypothetical protein [Chromobacterium haemolyticum]NHR08030.1 hypothetical protein [Chromobacterium haemolyticum]
MSLQEFFHRYQAQFSALNTDGLVELFAVPFTAIFHGELTVWTDRDNLRETVACLLAWYRRQGFLSATHTLADVLPMGPDAATAVVEWTVSHSCTGLWRDQTGYHLQRVNGEWRVYGLIQY